MYKEIHLQYTVSSNGSHAESRWAHCHNTVLLSYYLFPTTKLCDMFRMKRNVIHVPTHCYRKTNVKPLPPVSLQKAFKSLSALRTYLRRKRFRWLFIGSGGAADGEKVNEAAVASNQNLWLYAITGCFFNSTPILNILRCIMQLLTRTRVILSVFCSLQSA